MMNKETTRPRRKNTATILMVLGVTTTIRMMNKEATHLRSRHMATILTVLGVTTTILTELVVMTTMLTVLRKAGQPRS